MVPFASHLTKLGIFQTIISNNFVGAPTHLFLFIFLPSNLI
ncbi:hypothetical protein LEP1GSC178_0463 [Leptospira licerasiae str. MMD4847]|uniref:Uncharacterized protein n=1 Tax=Leptospira licerasiae str. MMD4847 TaxID=1049971 RepID=A0ABN0H7I0_9LEPT|nr:hypothetical protein LEP1GSC178_0463 [Leptospira licerasiae str. MMD4847]